jgi:hypothetical protein
LIGEDLALKISDRMSLKERSQFFPNLSETGAYRLTFDSSLYISNPVAGSKANDVLFTTGVSLSFKQ